MQVLRAEKLLGLCYLRTQLTQEDGVQGSRGGAAGKRRNARSVKFRAQELCHARRLELDPSRHREPLEVWKHSSSIFWFRNEILKQRP